MDVNNALDGDGPFAPDRAGSIPSSELIKVCFSGQYTREELLKFVSSKGGLVAYLGTNSVMEVMGRIAEGDQRAQKVLDAMCYNIAKQIGAMAAALSGRVDGILLTAASPTTSRSPTTSATAADSSPRSRFTPARTSWRHWWPTLSSSCGAP